MVKYFNAKGVKVGDVISAVLGNGMRVNLTRLPSGSFKAVVNGEEWIHDASTMRNKLELLDTECSTTSPMSSREFIYARVSTAKQSLDSQLDVLKGAYPRAKVITDKASGKTLERKGFEHLNSELQEGDTVIIYDLSRLGRNTQELLELVDDWSKRGIGLVVQNLGGSPVDTRTATGKLMFTVLAAVGQMQREIQNEKTQLGVDRAKAQGKFKGKQQTQKTIDACQKAMEYLGKGLSKEAAAKAAGIGVATLYRWIRDNKTA
ncbi:TPA: recombinase family protein [Vibrio parahaemolyticus]